MIEMRKRFDEITKQRDSKRCETCPIYFECQEMPDRYDDHPIYDFDDLLFAYLVKGKDFKDFLEKLLTSPQKCVRIVLENQKHT